MKKILSILLIGFLAIGLTGCRTTEEEAKSQTLVCTINDTEDEMTIEQVISMTYENNELKNMKMEVNTKITDDTVKENWDAYKEYMDENNQEFTKDGISLKVDVNDKTYEYNTILDIDVDKASEEDLKEQGFEGLKDDTSTLEENKELAEKDGATCIIK